MILHVDANSAYLGWTAAALLEKGYPVDLRKIPAVIAGDPADRHGIILAASIPAKERGVHTACSLYEAFRLCPNLQVFPPDYDLFLSCSEAMYRILLEYTPLVQRYSIDECFLDYGGCRRRFGDPVETAFSIKERIKAELGFTVNVGVGPNKVTAKMAGELKKPDRVHTLITKEELKQKLWPLPAGKLFMAGKASVRKLEKINITTIGQIACADPAFLRQRLNFHGMLLWSYANGIDYDRVVPMERIEQKGFSNSMTLPCDVEDAETAKAYILSLTERIAGRLRRQGSKASLIGITLKTGAFFHYSHQLKLPFYTDDTTTIYRYAVKLFGECWRGEPLRQIGVHLGDLAAKDAYQLSFDELSHLQSDEALNTAVDRIRERFGQRAIYRGTFVNTQMKPLEGGVNDGNYMMMGGYKQ